jgi:tetratricopeptide (TPR) repeat protein
MRLIASSSLLALSLCAAASAGAEQVPAATMEDARAAYDAGDWDDAASRFEAVYEASGKDSPQRAEAALERANIAWEQGDYATARRWAEEALELARALKLDAAVGRLLLTLGHIEASEGKLGQARQTFQLCVQLAKEQQDNIFGALCRMNLSLVERTRGQKPDEAKIKADIASLQKLGTPMAVGAALAKTAELYEQRGELEQANLMLSQAQERFAAAGNVPAQSRNALRQARVLQSMGRHAEAKSKVDAALPALKRMKNRPSLVLAYGLLGKDAEQRGAQSDAVEHYLSALKVANETKSPQLIAQGQLAVCEALMRPTIDMRAETYCVQAAARFEQLKVYELAARAQIAAAQLKQTSGALADARKLYLSAIKMLEEKVSPEVLDKRALAQQKVNVCQVEVQLEVTGALVRCRDALKSVESASKPPYGAAHAAALYNVGVAAQREKQWSEALSAFDRAASAYDGLSERVRAADARLRLGTLAATLKDQEARGIAALRAGIKGLGADVAQPDALQTAINLRVQLIQLLLATSQHAEALSVADELLPLVNTPKLTGQRAWTMQARASAQLKLGQRDAAISSLEEGAKLAKQAGDKELAKMMEDSLKQLKK